VIKVARASRKVSLPGPPSQVSYMRPIRLLLAKLITGERGATQIPQANSRTARALFRFAMQGIASYQMYLLLFIAELRIQFSIVSRS
jgi:hypothetical protein